MRAAFYAIADCDCNNNLLMDRMIQITEKMSPVTEDLPSSYRTDIVSFFFLAIVQ